MVHGVRFQELESSFDNETCQVVPDGTVFLGVRSNKPCQHEERLHVVASLVVSIHACGAVSSRGLASLAR